MTTETRGDLNSPWRKFTYDGTANGVSVSYLLKSVSNFSSTAVTTYNYDANGFVNEIIDRLSRHTTFVNLATTGAVTKMTHLWDGSYRSYSYDPE